MMGINNQLVVQEIVKSSEAAAVRVWETEVATPVSLPWVTPGYYESHLYSIDLDSGTVIEITIPVLKFDGGK